MSLEESGLYSIGVSLSNRVGDERQGWSVRARVAGDGVRRYYHERKIRY